MSGLNDDELIEQIQLEEIAKKRYKITYSNDECLFIGDTNNIIFYLKDLFNFYKNTKCQKIKIDNIICPIESWNLGDMGDSNIYILKILELLEIYDKKNIQDLFGISYNKYINNRNINQYLYSYTVPILNKDYDNMNQYINQNNITHNTEYTDRNELITNNYQFNGNYIIFDFNIHNQNNYNINNILNDIYINDISYNLYNIILYYGLHYVSLCNYSNMWYLIDDENVIIKSEDYVNNIFSSYKVKSLVYIKSELYDFTMRKQIKNIPVGIKNNGNTCFINASLQVLLSIPELYHFLNSL